MFEEIVGDLDDRTPNEEDMLNSIIVGDFQYQVWVHRELKGTFLSLEDAKKASAHAWEDRGYPTVRFRKEYAASKYWLLEVHTPTRWMTSDTFIVQIHIAKPVGIAYWG